MVNTLVYSVKLCVFDMYFAFKTKYAFIFRKINLFSR